MNNNTLYFDAVLGQFIRKSDYDMVSINPTLEVQHGLPYFRLVMGRNFRTRLKVYISHAKNFYSEIESTATNVNATVRIAPFNEGGVRIWQDVLSKSVPLTKPAGTSNAISFTIDGFNLPSDDFPIGEYWMEIEFSVNPNWTRTLALNLTIC